MRRVRFLILGTPRSGTTLLQRLANELGGVAVPPETHFFEFWRTCRRTPSFPLDVARIHEILEAFLRLPTSRDLPLHAQAVVEAVGGTCNDPLDLFDGIVSALAGPAEVLGEKTPRHLPWWRPLATLRPDLKFVGVVREPRAVVRSLQEMTWADDRHELLAERWALDQRELLAARTTLGPERCRIFHYEELVASPERVRDRLGTFLGCQPQVDPAEGVDFILPWEDDWKQDAREAITTHRIDAWRTTMPERQAQEVAAICRRGMIAFGYRSEAPTLAAALPTLLRVGVRNMSRWRFRLQYRRARPGVDLLKLPSATSPAA